MNNAECEMKRRKVKILRTFRIYANGKNEYCKSYSLETAMWRVRRRVISTTGTYVFGGAEMLIGEKWIKVA
jgi:hypothetical protein